MGVNQPCININGNCPLGFQADTSDLVNSASRVWGSGIAGFNHSFRLSDFPQGLSNIVAVDEIRAGISPIDSRGVWAMGMGGASITGAHQGGPNSAIGDAITSCHALTDTMGALTLKRLGMPCELMSESANFAATARSLHSGLVQVLRLDGSVEPVVNLVENEVWLNLHSRERSLVDQLLQ
jgi:hypothetical protein